MSKLPNNCYNQKNLQKNIKNYKRRNTEWVKKINPFQEKHMKREINLITVS